MSKAFTSAGTTLAITATLPASNTETGFTAITPAPTVVGEITDIGEYGRSYNLVTHNPIGDRRTVKRKGAYNDGALTLSMARVPDDAGQAILIAALDSDDDYSFKITLQDGTVQWFVGQVMSYTTNVGSVDQITSASVTVEIVNDIVEIEAA